MSEIYKEGVYRPFLQDKRDMTILDIGANIGITSYYFSQHARQVYSLEPSKDHFGIFTRMLEFNQIQNVKAINKAIYIDSKPHTLHHNPNKTMYSLHGAVSDGTGEEVETMTLKELFEQEKIEHVDLMKLDIEGSEIEVLSHSDFVELAPKMDLLITERHDWSGRNPNQLTEALKNAGFKVDQAQSSADLVIGYK